MNVINLLIAERHSLSVSSSLHPGSARKGKARARWPGRNRVFAGCLRRVSGHTRPCMRPPHCNRWQVYRVRLPDRTALGIIFMLMLFRSNVRSTPPMTSDGVSIAPPTCTDKGRVRLSVAGTNMTLYHQGKQGEHEKAKAPDVLVATGCSTAAGVSGETTVAAVAVAEGSFGGAKVCCCCCICCSISPCLFSSSA